MKEVVSLALLAGGSRLTIYGVSAYAASKATNIKRVPGSPTDKAKCMLIGGVVVIIIGLVGLLHGSKAN